LYDTSMLGAKWDQIFRILLVLGFVALGLSAVGVLFPQFLPGNGSLRTGIIILMFTLFLADEIGSTEVRAIVEGDDGLFSMVGRFPTQEEFANLGLVIKIETHRDLAKASFCGLIFDREDLINITDPIKVIQTTGWTTRQYAASSSRRKLELLKCKALSVLYQYNGCPIITQMAMWLLRCTRSVRARPGQTGVWERELLQEALNWKIEIRKPSMRTRLLVEEKFGVSVENQFRLEQYFDSKSTIEPIQNDIVLMYSHPDAHDYYFNYVRNVNMKDKLVNEPAFGANAIPAHQLTVGVAPKR